MVININNFIFLSESWILIYIIFLSMATVQGINDKKQPRIVNGISAKPGELPYQVSLQYAEDSFHFCGGSILNENFVITAGHCANDKDEQIQAVVGGTNLDAPKAIHNVTKMYVHEKFRVPSHYANDIALIKVDTPFKFDNFISPVALPKSHEILKINEKAVASGWGSMKGLELSLPKKLKKVEVSIVDQEYCRNLYKSLRRTIYPEQLCTHEIGERRKGVCVGDSGGPVTIRKNLLIGIISWSHKDPDCASPLYPDVQIRVSEYVDWINKHMKKM